MKVCSNEKLERLCALRFGRTPSHFEEGEGYKLSDILDRKEGCARGIAYAAGICAVADMDNALKAALDLLEHVQIGTDAQRQNGRIDGDLVRAVVLVFNNCVGNTGDVLYQKNAAITVDGIVGTKTWNKLLKGQ